MASDASTSVTLRDYWRVIWLRKWLVVIAVLVCGISAFVVSNSRPRLYQATALLMYQQPSNIANPLATDTSTDVTTLTLQVQSVVNTINSPDVAKGAASALKDVDGSAVDLSVTAAIMPPDASTGSTVSDVVGVTAESTDPSVSATAANAYAAALIAQRVGKERERLRQAQEAIRAQMSNYPTDQSKLTTDYVLLVQRLRDLQVAEATASGDFLVIKPASPPDSPTSPKPLQSAAIGLLVGAFVGVALAFVVGQFDTRVRGHREVAQLLDMPVVARVPAVSREAFKNGPLVALTDPRGEIAESLRVLRSNLEWMRIDGEVKTVIVTSCTKGEGKTVTASNLAITLAAAGKQIVLVDGDLRAPRVHTAFALPNTVGLSTVLQGSVSLTDALQPFELELRFPRVMTLASSGPAGQKSPKTSALRVLTSGPLPPNAGEVVASHKMAKVAASLAELDVDYVLIDAPPILGVSDVGSIAPLIDGVLVIANLDRVRQHTLEDGREALGVLPCRKLGAVVVGERVASSRYGYGGYGAREGDAS
jgi:Mrp family chromosome partitioning ATPase/capsular polysaccharide biosynthesis protein